MKILYQLVNEGSQDYYNPSFRNTLEAHLKYLREVKTTYAAPVPPMAAVIYNQDLFGYLTEINIAPHLHWLVMRMNNFFSPYDFDAKCTQLLIPSTDEVDVLRQSWNTTPVITT